MGFDPGQLLSFLHLSSSKGLRKVVLKAFQRSESSLIDKEIFPYNPLSPSTLDPSSNFFLRRN